MRTFITDTRRTPPAAAAAAALLALALGLPNPGPPPLFGQSGFGGGDPGGPGGDPGGPGGDPGGPDEDEPCTFPGYPPCPEELADPNPPFCLDPFSACADVSSDNCPSGWPGDPDAPGCDYVTGDQPERVSRTCVSYPPRAPGEVGPYRCTRCVSGRDTKVCYSIYACERSFRDQSCVNGYLCRTFKTGNYQVTENCASS